MDIPTLKKALRPGDWTLFLDRDGVINRRKMDGYIQHSDEFELLDGVEEAVFEFQRWVNFTFVVTNQRGIARGLMTESDLEAVHGKMVDLFRKSSIYLDGIFYCPHDRDEGCTCRKPGIGMPLQAKEKHPNINFERSIMIGDTASDMEMGRQLGMVCIHVGPEVVAPELYDIHLDHLKDFWAS